jgi:phospholipid/cholesterol/gamma-HCH transport system substrate-binding protein
VARALTVVALAATVTVVALLMFGGFSGDYKVGVTLDNASQLVTGDQVKVGGVPVGTIDSITLSRDHRAHLKLSISDEGLTPLHEGTKAIVRSTSLSGIANRYIALQPGPNSARKIHDGDEIPAANAQDEVDLDEVLNTLDPATQRDLHAATRSSAQIYGTRQIDPRAIAEANAGLHVLNPALSQSALTTRELARDQAMLARFVVKSADVVSQVSSRPDDLDQLVTNAGGSLGAVAAQSSALESVIAQLPPTLRKTNTSLVNLRATLKDVRPALREARPAAPLLATFLTRLQPVARASRPLVPQVRRAIDRPGGDDLLGALRSLPPLSKAAVPAFASTVQTVKDAMPVVRDARPYTPDLLGGLFNGFGGATGGYYDANGHYVRISFQGNLYSLTGPGSLVPLPPSQQGISGYRNHVNKRCPGAGTQPAADGSNPFRDGRGDAFPCSIGDTPR